LDASVFRKLISCAAVALALTAATPAQESDKRYSGQFAQDWEAGRVPTPDEVAQAERAAAARPDDGRAARRLAKGYFFQYFGARRAEALSKSRQAFAKALTLMPDDAESIVYAASLDALEAVRGLEGAERDAKFKSALEGLERAQKLAPRHGAVLSVSIGTYLWFPDSYGTVPRAAALAEGMRKAMGPAFSRFSPHGQQRILLSQGQAYARLGRLDEAQACFEQGLAVASDTVEFGLLEAELEKLAGTRDAGPK
jgi:tetratricopeptide (TPR) repeat protein